MAHRPSNIARNIWTLESLQIQPTDRLLEIGYGPGIALERSTDYVVNGAIVGIDCSATMFAQASKRNRVAIRDSRMRLYTGCLEDLPQTEGCFDKIYSSNVVQFWDDPAAEFSKLRKLLLPRGKIATTYMPRNANPTSVDTRRMSEVIQSALREAGFSQIKALTKPFGKIDAVCILAAPE